MLGTMYYTIYKTTNIVNNKIYIGAHATDNLDDYYIGSGADIIEDIKKYGRKNFKKEILMLFDSEDEMFLNEKIIVSKEFIKDNSNYNLRPGGKGNSKGNIPWNKGLSKEIDNRVKGHPSWNLGLKIGTAWNSGIKTGPNPKISSANKGKPKPPRTKEHSNNISKAKKGKPNPKLSAVKRGKPSPKKGIGIKVRCVELDMVFNTAYEAAEYLKVKSASSIRAAAQGITKFSYGYHWEITK